MCKQLRKIFSWFPETDGKEPKYPPVQQLQIGDLAYYDFGESASKMRIYCQVITEKKFIKAIHHRLIEKNNKDRCIYVDTVIGYDVRPSSELTKITDIDAEIDFVKRCNGGKIYKNNIIEFLEEAKAAVPV